MNGLRKNLRAGMALTIIALAICVTNFRPASGQAMGGPLVTVANTGANPVPVVGSTTVSGTVSVSNTPNVSVTNTPNVNISNTPNVSITNTPNVMLAGTPTVNLGNGSGGAPTVGLADGSTVSPIAILDNVPNVVEEPGLDPGATQDYHFPRTVKTSTLIISTVNEVDVLLSVNPPSGVQYGVPLGRIHPAAGPLVINFVQPVPIEHMTVHNPGFPNVIHATFAISALGN